MSTLDPLTASLRKVLHLFDDFETRKAETILISFGNRSIEFTRDDYHAMRDLHGELTSESPLPDNLASLQERRWDVKHKPSDHKPSDALNNALRYVEEDPEHWAHAVVILGRINEDESPATCVLNAGAFDSFAQYGLASEALRILMGNEQGD